MLQVQFNQNYNDSISSKIDVIYERMPFLKEITQLAGQTNFEISEISFKCIFLWGSKESDINKLKMSIGILPNITFSTFADHAIVSESELDNFTRAIEIFTEYISSTKDQIVPDEEEHKLIGDNEQVVPN